MSDLIVTTLQDVVDAGDGELSLREALVIANGDADTTTITFAAGLIGAIHLGADGSLMITQSVAIDGNGPIAVDAMPMAMRTPRRGRPPRRSASSAAVTASRCRARSP